MLLCISHTEITETTEIDFAAQNSRVTQMAQMTQIFSPGGEIRVSHRKHIVGDVSRTQRPTGRRRIAAQGRGEDSSIVAA